MTRDRKHEDVGAAAKGCLPSEQVASNGAADATEQIDGPDTKRPFLFLHKLMPGTPGRGRRGRRQGCRGGGGCQDLVYIGNLGHPSNISHSTATGMQRASNDHLSEDVEEEGVLREMSPVIVAEGARDELVPLRVAAIQVQTLRQRDDTPMQMSFVWHQHASSLRMVEHDEAAWQRHHDDGSDHRSSYPDPVLASKVVEGKEDEVHDEQPKDANARVLCCKESIIHPGGASCTTVGPLQLPPCLSATV